MKLIFLCFILHYFLLYSFTKYSHLSKIKIKKIYHKQTPKAEDLKDHYGYHPLNSPYGPQNQKLLYTNNEVLNANIDNCQISTHPNYEICSYMTSCNSCAALNECGYYLCYFFFFLFLNSGWCAVINQCLPGSLSSCSCNIACPNDWLYSYTLCPSVFIAKKIKLIEPEIAKPKIHIFSKKIKNIKKIGIIGDQEDHNIINQIDRETGETVSSHIITNKKIYGTIEQPIEIVQHDIVNLDGTPPKKDVIQYHGLDV